MQCNVTVSRGEESKRQVLTMLMHPTTSTLFLRFHTGWESPYITDMTSPSATATDGFVPPRESEILGHPSRRPAQVPPPPQVRTPTLRQASPNASPSQVKTEPHHRDAATITRHTPNAVVQLRKKENEKKEQGGRSKRRQRDWYSACAVMCELHICTRAHERDKSG